MCKEIKNTDARCTNEKVQGFHVVAVTNRTLSKRPYLEQIRKICEWGPGCHNFAGKRSDRKRI